MTAKKDSKGTKKKPKEEDYSGPPRRPPAARAAARVDALASAQRAWPPLRADDSEDEPVEAEEEVESEATKKKKAKSRKAFYGLLRWLLAFVPLAMVISQQPMMIRPREAGVNRRKVVPLQLAVTGAIHWAATSPTTLRNPAINQYINTTARVLLTPYEWGKAHSSKRAMPNEKTWTSAWKKSERALPRLVDHDTGLKELIKIPLTGPNVPLIGAYLLAVGVFIAVLQAGGEYLVIGGCGAILQGCRGLGMEPQPELYVAGVAAVLGIVCSDVAGKKQEAPKKKRR